MNWPGYVDCNMTGEERENFKFTRDFVIDYLDPNAEWVYRDFHERW